jgi:hypothetical protein
MLPVIRDLLLSDIGPAVRLLEECRGLPDTKPGDVDLAAQRAAAAFDRIREGKKPLHITSEDLEAAVARTRPSVTAEIRDRFAEEVGRFARV